MPTIAELLAREVSALPEDPAPKVSGQMLKRSRLGLLPQPEPLISGLMSRRGVTLLVGGYGVGKTFLGLSIAASVGSGHQWLGRDVHQCPVLYVLGEGAYGVDSRLAAWESAWGTEIADDQVVFLVQPDSLAPVRQFGMPPLCPTWDQITARARWHDAGLVVLDTFSSLAPEADETKDSPWLIRRCSELASDINGAVLLIHHPGHANQDRARGAYALEANSDEVLLVEGDGAFTTITRKKVRDGPAGGKVQVKRQPWGDSMIIQHANDSEIRSDRDNRALDLIRAAFGEDAVTRTDLAGVIEATGGSRSSSFRVVGDLIQRGELIPGPRRGRTETYRLK